MKLSHNILRKSLNLIWPHLGYPGPWGVHPWKWHNKLNHYLLLTFGVTDFLRFLETQNNEDQGLGWQPICSSSLQVGHVQGGGQWDCSKRISASERLWRPWSLSFGSCHTKKPFDHQMAKSGDMAPKTLQPLKVAPKEIQLPTRKRSYWLSLCSQTLAKNAQLKII